MLNLVCQVRDAILKENGGIVPVTLEMVSSIVEMMTPIDEIIFIEYQAPATNPIWGQFQKWTYLPTAYASFTTRVEVRYASHLSEEWRRFVVCKELCHALDESTGSHSASGRSVDNLLKAFALISTQQRPRSTALAYQAEVLAEIGAIELLCPLQIREPLVTEDPDEISALAKQFGIPEDYAEYAFRAESLGTLAHLMET